MSPEQHAGSGSAGRATEIAVSDTAMDEARDELPADLQPDEFQGEYQFPDNSRRRLHAVIYALAAVGCLAVWSFARAEPFVNDGWVIVAMLLGVFAAYSFVVGAPMRVDEQEALVRAQQAVGYPVGYASAQQVWRTALSRPTWRVLCYSIEDPPQRRGLVAVDAISADVVEQLVQPTEPDEWSTSGTDDV